MWTAWGRRGTFPLHLQVRLSMMIALPTDADLAETEMAGAGEYILTLRSEGDEAVTVFYEARNQERALERH